MESPLPPDPYAALGLPTDATAAAIKSSYRKLALKYHPDKVVGDDAAKAAAQDEFHKIQQAYEILNDQDKRERYDAQVRLAEMRRRHMEQHTEFRGVRMAAGSFFTHREPQFEERRPSYFDDDDVHDSPSRSAYTRKRTTRTDRERDTEAERKRERARAEEDRRRADRADRDRKRDADIRAQRMHKQESYKPDKEIWERERLQREEAERRRERDTDLPRDREREEREKVASREEAARRYMESTRRAGGPPQVTTASYAYTYTRAGDPTANPQVRRSQARRSGSRSPPEHRTPESTYPREYEHAGEYHRAPVPGVNLGVPPPPMPRRSRTSVEDPRIERERERKSREHVPLGPDFRHSAPAPAREHSRSPPVRKNSTGAIPGARVVDLGYSSPISPPHRYATEPVAAPIPPPPTGYRTVVHAPSEVPTSGRYHSPPRVAVTQVPESASKIASLASMAGQVADPFRDRERSERERERERPRERGRERSYRHRDEDRDIPREREVVRDSPRERERTREKPLYGELNTGSGGPSPMAARGPPPVTIPVLTPSYQQRRQPSRDRYPEREKRERTTRERGRGGVEADFRKPTMERSATTAY